TVSAAISARCNPTCGAFQHLGSLRHFEQQVCMTLRWRELDSNRRFGARQAPFCLTVGLECSLYVPRGRNSRRKLRLLISESMRGVWMEAVATILHADLDAFYASVEQLLDSSPIGWSTVSDRQAACRAAGFPTLAALSCGQGSVRGCGPNPGSAG